MDRKLSDAQKEWIREDVTLMFSNSDRHSRQFAGSGVVHKDEDGRTYKRPMGDLDIGWEYVVSVLSEPDKSPEWYIEGVKILDLNNDQITPRGIDQKTLDELAYTLSLRWYQLEMGFEAEKNPRPTYSKVSYVSVPPGKEPKFEDKALVSDGILQIVDRKIIIDIPRLTGKKLRSKAEEIAEEVASISKAIAQHYGKYGALRLDITPGQAILTAGEKVISTDQKTAPSDVSYAIAALSNFALANRRPSVGHTGYERVRSSIKAETEKPLVVDIEAARKFGNPDLFNSRASLEG